jgi:hypothetical protein
MTMVIEIATISFVAGFIVYLVYRDIRNSLP